MSKLIRRLRDAFNEYRIGRCMKVVRSSRSHNRKIDAFDRMAKLINSRSPQQVSRMELAQGLV